MFELALSDESTRELASVVGALAEIKSVENDADARRADCAVKAAKTVAKNVHDQRMAISRKVDTVKKALVSREAEICAELNAELERVQKCCGEYVAAKARENELAVERAAILGEQSAASGKPVDGVKARETWCFRVVDPFAVPRAYCKPDETAIRAMMDAAKRNGAKIESVHVDGVEFYREFRV